MVLHKFFIAGFFLVSSHVAFAESCQEKVNSDGAYRYSHSIPIGNGMYECYVIAKDGSGQPIKDSIAFDEQTLSNPKPEAEGNKEEQKTEATAACNYKFNKSNKPAGNDPLTNLLCDAASQNSPSYLIYPLRKDKKLAKQLTEIDALNGKNWYECKCGYLSTVEGMKKGKKNAALRFEGPSGLDKKINVQSSIATECGYNYRIIVANPIVGEFFRERYPSVTVEVLDFEPCE